MALKRMDNVGIVVDDLVATIEFFRELGLERVRPPMVGTSVVMEAPPP